MKTLYDILQVCSTATPASIAAAYDRLADEYKGALDASAKARLDAIERAHATLTHPTRRQEYDRRLAARAKRGAGTIENARKLGSFAAIALAAIAPFCTIFTLRSPGPTAPRSGTESAQETSISVTAPQISASDAPDEQPARRRSLSAFAVEPSVAPTASVDGAERPPQTALELEFARLQQEIQTTREEQAMRERELARRADLEERRMRMIERQDGYRIREEEARYIDNRMADRMSQLNAALDAQKDLNAAKMGVSRYQYDRLQEGQWQAELHWR